MSEQETGSARERHGEKARAFAVKQGWLYPEPDEPQNADPVPAEQTLALCFRCVTGTCGHHGQLPSPHSGTIPLHGVPAITAFRGTPLCLDCAMAVRTQ